MARRAAGRRVRGVRTTRGELHADRVVVCAGAWTARLLERLGPPPAIAPVLGQMILFLTRPGLIRHMVLARDRYVIPRRDGHVLVGSTLEHTGFRKATTAEAREDLHRSAAALFPSLKHARIGLIGRVCGPAPRAASPTSALIPRSPASPSMPATSATDWSPPPPRRGWPRT